MAKKTKEEILKQRNDLRWKIGQTIYKYRTELGESQQDLAELLGVRRQMISKLENGETNLPNDRALVLAAHFKINIAELVDAKTMDDLYTMDLPVFIQKEDYVGYDMVPSYVKKYDIKAATYKGVDGTTKNKTYRIDERLRGTTAEDLYVIEVTDDKNSLSLPSGAKLIVQRIKEEDYPTFDKPYYMVLERKVTLSSKDGQGEYDLWLEKHPVRLEFVTKVTPVDNASDLIKNKNADEKWFRYSMPNGQEWLVDSKNLKKMCRGIVRKIILDY